MFFLEIAFDQRAVGLGGAQIGADIADHLLAVEGSGAAHGVGFDVLVEAFVGIEFGAVTWQEIDPQRCPMTFAPTDGRPRQMHRMAVEDEEDFPSPILAQESAQKIVALWRRARARMAGYRRSSQERTALESCSKARRTGFWAVKPQRPSSRPAVQTESRTPKRRAISSTTASRVQR